MRETGRVEIGAADLPPAIGPYRVAGVLGRGGMGVVYRGEHVETGEAVAIKTVPAASEPTIASIRREIHALGRVRHPGVERVVAAGVADGLPWYAMQLLEGRTLREHLAELWAKPAHEVTSTASDATATLQRIVADGAADPDRARAPRTGGRDLGLTLTLIRRLAAPLAFLHGAGIVHRDLKPENVFLQDGDRPVLVDFGIAAEFGGREQLAAEGRVMGTIAYMAPEQIRGELVDARTDLYALGCILYEAATGRAPFIGAARAIVLQHVYEAPVPPSEIVEGIPEALDRLVLRLLEKQPEARLGYADDVAAALGALGAEREPDPGPRPQAYLYRPNLTGRGEVMVALGEHVRRLHHDGRGGIVLLRGESGVGKTRLAMELSRMAVQRSIQVITGQCVALGEAEPLRALRPALIAAADRARARGPDETARLVGAHGRVLAPYEPALLDLPGVRELPDPPALPPDAARARVIASLMAVLAALGTPAIVLVLDDLQWADELTLSLLAALAERGPGATLVLGTYRAEETRPELSALARSAGVSEIALGRLDAAGVGAMVSGMLALGEPPEPILDVLVDQSNGNPFFVAEYLRAAIGEGMLHRDDGRWRFADRGNLEDSLASLPLPETLAALIARRLDRLDADGRALTAWGAVLGREIDGDLLLSFMIDEAAAMETLDALRVRQIVEEAERGRLRFVHHKIREIAYERIPEADRRALHLRAGEAIEARRGEAADALPSLGLHFSRAGVPHKAARYLARAADRARAAYANGDAIELYRAAIHEARACGSDALARLHESLGDVLGLSGRQDEARAALGDALAEASPHEAVDRARLHRKIGKTWETLHHHAEALAAYTAAEEALGPPHDGAGDAWWSAWIAIHIDRISVYYWLAQLARIRALAGEIRPVIERRGTAQDRVQLFHVLTQMGVRSERFLVSAETVGYARACFAASEACDDEGEVAENRFSLAVVLVFHRAFAEAEPEMRRTLADAERLGRLPLRARCLTYLTMIQRWQGRGEETRRVAVESLAVAEGAQMIDYVGAARANLAWVALRGGDAAAAEAGAMEALALWRPLSYAFTQQWLALFPLIAISTARGDLASAIDHARALLPTTQRRLEGDLTEALQAALAAWDRDEREAAGERLQAALAVAGRLGYL